MKMETKEGMMPMMSMMPNMMNGMMPMMGMMKCEMTKDGMSCTMMPMKDMDEKMFKMCCENMMNMMNMGMPMMMGCGPMQMMCCVSK